MTYELHLRCNIGVPDGYNGETFRVASIVQNYDIYDANLVSFLNLNGEALTVSNNSLDVYANTSYSNIDSINRDPMQLDTIYYMYLSSNDKVFAKLQGNIARQPPPIVSDLTIERTDIGEVSINGNITNTIPFDYYIILSQNEKTQEALANIIVERSLSPTSNPTISALFSEPYERDQFPFLQYVRDYYAYIYAVNIHDIVSVSSIRLLREIGLTDVTMTLSDLRCVDMGNIETAEEIALDIRFHALPTSLEYYALAFSNTGTIFDDYTNFNIYTNDYTVTGNTENANVSFLITSDHLGNLFNNDSIYDVGTDVRVAILLVEKDTRQFSGTAYELDLNISFPDITDFGVVPLYTGYTLPV